jgi:hypothetical protein
MLPNPSEEGLANNGPIFVIRSERIGKAVWLNAAAPRPKWGGREAAIKFVTEVDARRVAIRIGGTWYVEPA